MNDLADSDRLKPLKQIFDPDNRFTYFGPSQFSLERFHSQINDLNLSNAVPLDVRIQFEGAKNALLYSYFSYRLGMASQMCAYATLELALKLKCEISKHQAPQNPSLKKYLRVAINQGWMDDTVFSYRAHLWPNMPNTGEVKMCHVFLDFVAGNGRGSPGKRNSLMHEPGHLDFPWESTWILNDVLVIINRLFAPSGSTG